MKSAQRGHIKLLFALNPVIEGNDLTATIEANGKGCVRGVCTFSTGTRVSVVVPRPTLFWCRCKGRQRPVGVAGRWLHGRRRNDRVARPVRRPRSNHTLPVPLESRCWAPGDFPGRVNVFNTDIPLARHGPWRPG